MRAIWRELRIELRMLGKAPALTLAAVFAFGLGIAAATAMLSVSRTFLSNPIFPEVDRLVMLLSIAPGQTEGWSEVSPANFREWREQNHSFESLAAYEWADVNLTGVGEPIKLQAFRVSADFFDVLRASPRVGRGFVNGEDQPGKDRQVVVSSGLWRRQFGSDADIIGRTIHIDGTPMQVVGVMNDGVKFPESAELWIPLAFSAPQRTVRNLHMLSLVGRLKAGVTLAQAQADMKTIQERQQAAFPETEKGWGVVAIQIGEFVAGPGRGYTIMSLWAVGFVLLVACTNVANLLLASNTARQNEFAIRVALGAGRPQLIRQALTSSVMLACGGALVGLLLGSWWISLIRGAMPPEVERYIPGWEQVRLDARLFLWAFGFAAAAGVVAGLLPAVYGSAATVNEQLKEAGRGGGTSVSRMRLRSAFVVVQVALSLVLLVGAALMARGVQTLFQMNFKFDPQAVTTFRVALPKSRYPTTEQRSEFFETLVNRLNDGSGIQSASVATQIPFAGGDSGSFRVEGQLLQAGEFPTADFNNIGPRYFELLRVPVVEGRDFDGRDVADSTPVAIISEKLAKAYWPERSALGRRIKVGDQNSPQPWATIVGVVGEISYNPWRHDALPAVYFPFRQRPWNHAYVALRASTDNQSLLPLLRAAVASIDPDQPVYDIFSLQRVISNQILGLSYVAVLMAVLGLIALLLCAVGISGMMAFLVTQRIHEIGVRMALGATPWRVLAMFVAYGIRLTAWGVAIGLPLAIALARFLSSLLYGVRSSDLVSFISGAIVLTAVVLLACFLPARRATRVDPMIALRYE
jgi:putative ABC transport system permease protein